MPAGPSNKDDKPGDNVHPADRKQRSESDVPIVHRTKKQETPVSQTTNRSCNNKDIPDRKQNTEPASQICQRRKTQETPKLKTSEQILHPYPSTAKNQPAKTVSSNPASSSATESKMPSGSKPVIPLAERKCLFCPIVQDVKNAVTRVYHGPWDENFLVIQPIGPVTEGHILVIPRQHVQDARAAKVFGKTCEAASEVAQKLYPGMDVNIETNQGLLADQSVPHLHVHVVPRRAGDGLAHPWTGQLAGHYNTTGQPKHPEHVLPKFPPKPKA